MVPKVVRELRKLWEEIGFEIRSSKWLAKRGFRKFAREQKRKQTKGYVRLCAPVLPTTRQEQVSSGLKLQDEKGLARQSG